MSDAAKKSAAPVDGATLMSGIDIRSILSSKGPKVKGVLLRHSRKDGKDVKPHPALAKADETHQKRVLPELVEELEIDTTPSKSAAAAVLGGPVTFVGQFPTEGTVVMARREIPDTETLESLSTGSLQTMCQEFAVETDGLVEKTELVEALSEAQLPVNPHKLQPPLDGIRVLGDMLILKVADTEEELNEATQAVSEVSAPNNDEFFLDYTREEYIRFAARTDVVAPAIEQDDDEDDDDDAEEDDEEDEGDGDDEDGEYVLGEDEECTDAEERGAMLNLLLSEVIRKFREEHERGPDTKELLELRSEVAGVLGLEVASFDEISQGIKREAEAAERSQSPNKKVKFTTESEEERGNTAEEDDRKPAAQSEDDDKAPAQQD